ncbi:MAG: hypothetical protein RL071_3549 [Pseudomonadota bacterium]|jgi:hypothetical protein
MSAPALSPPAALARGAALIALDPQLRVCAAQGHDGAPLPTGAPITAWLPGWRPTAGPQRLGALEVDALPLPDGGWALATRPRSRAAGLGAAVADPLMGVVLHELNNALTVIFGQAELGARGAPPAQERALSRVRTAADRLRDLAGAVVRLRSPAVHSPGAAILADDLVAVLGPHRTVGPPLEPAQLEGLEPLELAAIGAAIRTLPPMQWRMEGAAAGAEGLRITRAAAHATTPEPAVIETLAAAVHARGGAWSAIPGGWALRLRPAAAPVVLLWLQEPDLAALLREALPAVTARLIDGLPALAEAAAAAPAATVIADAAALRRGLTAAWPALRRDRPLLRLIVLHAHPDELPPGATGLPGPLDLAALQAALQP